MTVAVASSPISVYLGGQERVVPLAALEFNDTTGVLQINPGFPNGTTSYGAALPWLQYLAGLGIITPGTAAAPTPAMLIAAKFAGAWGNQVSVKVTYTNPTTYDLEVTATNRYVLTTATIGPVLGTQTITGSSPGLVRIKNADIVAGVVGMPAVLPSVPATLLGGTFTFAVPKQGGGTAFNIDAVNAAAPGDLIQVAITPGAGTSFTLDVTLKVTKTGNTSATTAGNINSAPVGYLINVSNPPPAIALKMPKAGTIFLSGGVDIATASASLQT